MSLNIDVISTEGRNIGVRQTLIDIAAEAGLDQSAAAAVLDSDQGITVLNDAVELSEGHQVKGVPFFIINNAVTLAGAQDSDTFLECFSNQVSQHF